MLTLWNYPRPRLFVSSTTTESRQIYFDWTQPGQFFKLMGLDDACVTSRRRCCNLLHFFSCPRVITVWSYIEPPRFYIPPNTPINSISSAPSMYRSRIDFISRELCRIICGDILAAARSTERPLPPFPSSMLQKGSLIQMFCFSPRLIVEHFHYSV